MGVTLNNPIIIGIFHEINPAIGVPPCMEAPMY